MVSRSISQEFSVSLKDAIARALDAKSAIDLVTIDLKGKSDIADYMMIASGTSTTHVGTLAQYVEQAFKANGVDILSAEGTPQNDWVLVDTPYIVVHLFRPEIREQFNLEKMWATDFSTLEKNREELVH